MNLHDVWKYGTLIWIGAGHPCPNKYCTANMTTDHHGCIVELIPITTEHDGIIYYCTCPTCRPREIKHYFRARTGDMGYTCKDCRQGRHPNP